MISIIICSRDAAALSAVSQNVAATIGIPYEIVVVDNSKGQYGICEAYNIGAARAHYGLLCFMHEDLAFHTPSWGIEVSAILADPAVGVLGVAGGTYEVCAPASWNLVGAEYIRMNVLHTVKGKTTYDRVAPPTGDIFDVAALDGLWLCCRKTVWEEVRFDAVTFPGFHFYDVDFCTRVFPRYKICVTMNILIEHFSYGSYTKPWFENAWHYYNKRRSYLPFGSVAVSAAEERRLRLLALQHFMRTYIDYELPLGLGFRLLTECLSLEPTNRDSYWLLKKYVKVRLLKQSI